MKLPKTAIVMMGCQNDYFAQDGRFDPVLEPHARRREVLGNIVSLVNGIRDTDALMLQLPMAVDASVADSMMDTPLEKIATSGALRPDSRGVALVEELAAFGDRIETVPGKHKVNGFRDTALEVVLREHRIVDTIMVGAVTSFSVDATARAAYERGYRVTVLEDGTVARNHREQEFYRSRIFPTYAEVLPWRRLVDPTRFGTAGTSRS